MKNPFQKGLKNVQERKQEVRKMSANYNGDKSIINFHFESIKNLQVLGPKHKANFYTH